MLPPRRRTVCLLLAALVALASCAPAWTTLVGPQGVSCPCDHDATHGHDGCETGRCHEVAAEVPEGHAQPVADGAHADEPCHETAADPHPATRVAKQDPPAHDGAASMRCGCTSSHDAGDGVLTRHPASPTGEARFHVPLQPARYPTVVAPAPRSAPADDVFHVPISAA